MTEDAVDAVIVFMPLFFYINSFFHNYDDKSAIVKFAGRNDNGEKNSAV